MTYNFDGRPAVRAPDYLKKALIDYLETGEVELPSYPAYLTAVEGAQARLEWLTEELWDCTEHLPPMYCDDLGLPGRATYGDAARYLRHKEDLRSSRRTSSSS
ncbi:MAG: hypothetical protein QOG21_1919 [Actinomycetota bacterium]|nr:hypothetical protein [Actinomycetota bacterium]